MLEDIESVAVRACEAGVPHVEHEDWYVAARPKMVSTRSETTWSRRCVETHR